MSVVSESIGANRTARQAPILGPAGTQLKRAQDVAKAPDVLLMPPSKLDRDPAQPRETFDEDDMVQLMTSLREHGQLQPIVAWWDEAAEVYRIVAGERRWKAAKAIGLEKIQVKVLPGKPEDGKLTVIQLVENMHRADISPMEQAKAFRRVLDTQGWTHQRLAGELGISDGQVAKMLKLLTLPGEIQERVVEGKLPGATAYALAGVADPVEQAHLAEEAIAGKLTRDQVAERAKRPNSARPKPAPVILTGEGISVTIRGSAGDRAALIRLALDLLAAEAGGPSTG